ncbi:Tetratricopeptide-like helical domain superfamily [Sesbania bispinosa]|nr:Tetratricopeptide-like helical domain superfamily [Sesbania bispinosa]
MGFQHLSQSYEIMTSLLVEVGLLREAEDLLSALEGRGVLLNRSEIFDKLIEGFDLVDLGVPLSGAEMNTLENVMVLLCINGKIQEARSMVRKILPLNSEVSSLVFDEIAFGYCEKKDFKDLVSFFVEVKCAPTVKASNRVINSLCSSYGVENAEMFLQELESLGFRPDEVTYGILIGWSCHEGKMKNALSHLSVLLSKSLVPHTYTYNALISGLFKVGMLEHARDILDEMIDRGTTPDISTFKVLIAGYCKSKRFDKVKSLIHEMENRGLIELSLMENPLSKAFQILGLNPLSVRLKRDNDRRLSKTEFFDDIGNGLYLDTDVDEYEKHITRVLEESILPNFNSSISKECNDNNLKNALILVEEMQCWGQELLLPEFSKLVRQLCSSRSQINSVIKLLEKIPRSVYKLDQETLNLVVQAYSKKGLLCKAKTMLDEMLQNKFLIKNETYTAIFIPLCKKGNMKDFNYYWNIACRNKWFPGLEEFKLLLGHICHQKMLGEALQFLEIMLLSHPHLRYDKAIALKDTVLKEQPSFSHAAHCALICGFCNMGNIGKADTLLRDMLSQGLSPDDELCNMLIQGHCQANDSRKVGELLGVAIRKSWELSLSSYRYLVRWMCVKAGNSLVVNKILAEMEEKKVVLNEGVKPSNRSLRKVISSLCDTGELQKALDLSQEMGLRSWIHDSVIQTAIVESLLSCGKIQEAESFLDRMGEESLTPDNINYDCLIKRFCQYGRLNKAVHLMNIMLKKQCIPVSTSYDFLIHGFCAQNKLDMASDFYTEMLNWNLKPRIDTMERLVLSFCHGGRTDQAEQFLKDMIHGGETPTRKMYSTVIKSFHMEKNLRKASELMQAMQENGYQPDFEIHWSLISNLSSAKTKDTDNGNKGFLLKLLSKSGFPQKK